VVYLCRVDRTDDTAKSAVPHSGGRGTAAMYDNMLWCIYVGLTGRMTQLKVLCLMVVVKKLCKIL